MDRASSPARLDRSPVEEAEPLVPSRIPVTSRHHQPRQLTAEARERFRQMAADSRAAKLAAVSGLGPAPLHDLNVPRLDPETLMPAQTEVGLGALSLFSGGGGLDLGFERAGFSHVASYEILEDAAATLVKARPDWDVRGGADGDVSQVNWRKWRDDVQIVHGGPPCQPFSVAGRQRGAEDERNMWPAFVESVLATRPLAFVAENVPALASTKFQEYVRSEILEPLSRRYSITMFTLRAEDFGVPQTRRRVFFVGFARKRDAARFLKPAPTHYWGEQAMDSTSGSLKRCMGLREALGLAEIGYDALSPTIRSTLTGPRHTTSILNSVAAQRIFERLEIWPNGVAATRDAARDFVAKNGHFRLSVPDVSLIQGFPEEWPFVGATYMKLGQIGNAVPPPLGYAVASSVRAALA